MGIKKASSLVFWFLRLALTPALYLIFGFLFDRKTAKGIKRPCLILANHQTGIDQFAVTMGFNFGINYVATDTIFRHGFWSRIMVALARPIPFSKGSSDMLAVKNMMSVIKSGGAVAMFPSGNRCCYGEESPIIPGIGRLAKIFKAPLVLVQLRGGYFVKPRWMHKPCRGKMRAGVARVVSPQELSAMSAGEVSAIIEQALLLDDFEYNKTAQNVYRGRRKAEYLESMLFYCPQCASMISLRSEGNDIFCKDCGARVMINGEGFFVKISNAETIPDTILAWSRIQLEYIKNIDFSGFTCKPVFCDDNVELFIAERAKREKLLANGAIALYADRLDVCGRFFLLNEITMAVVGARKLTIYHKSGVFAVVVPLRINLMKYMICGCHLRNKALDIKEEFYGY